MMSVAVQAIDPNGLALWLASLETWRDRSRTEHVVSREWDVRTRVDIFEELIRAILL